MQDASGANLRTGPGLSYPVVDILMAQTPLRIEGKNGDWYSVTTLEGEKGYVHQSLIETVGEPEAAAQSQEMPLPEAQQPVPSMPSSQTPAMPSNIEFEAGTQSEPMSIESSAPTQPAETGG
ncbi:MAG TPA: SH3 domain-containing protein, partial [Terriglobales bacterium]|nr:SH3 domain-containing protein [Terriglobales bacterium]